MAINQTHRGFTLLIAVIFMSVMLSFGLAIGSLAYKQITLASTATDSQYAFYAADAALECVLYTDQQSNPSPFAYPASDPGLGGTPSIMCDGSPAISKTETYSAASWIVTNRLSLDSNKRCADVTVYKYASPTVVNGKTVTTYVFSQGYSVPCASVGTSPRATSRGEDIYY